MKYKTFFKIFAFSFLLSLSSTIISDWRIDYNSLIGFVGYFFFSIYCIKNFGKKFDTRNILLSLLAIQCLLHINTIYGYFFYSLFSLPLVLLHVFGIVSGYLYLQLRNYFKVLPFLIFSVFAVFMFSSGWDYWIHRINHGTFTGRVEAYNPPAKFESFNEEKNLITDGDFSGKIVLLDFWTTTCGLCFQKFPHLQSVFEKYKNDSSIIILAVNAPIEEDKPNQAFQMIRNKNYSFPVVITKEADLAEKFGVLTYPKTFVISQHNQIVYRGDIEGAVKMVDELKSNSR